MNMGNALKRLSKALVIIFLVVIGALATIPLFFRDQVQAKIEEEINKNLDAVVSVSGVSLSLFSNFPDLTVCVEGFEVKGKNLFDKMTLASINELTLTIDLLSFFDSNRPWTIESVSINQPEFNILMLRDGSANYNIFKETTMPETEGTGQEPAATYEIDLENMVINQGNFKYHDKSSDITLNLLNLNHQSRGTIAADRYELNTATSIGSMTVDYGGVGYLDKARVNLDADFGINLAEMTVNLLKNKLRVNALEVNLEGGVKVLEDGLKMNLKARTPQNSFKELLSLIPGAYTTDFDKVKADGKFAFNAGVDGTYKYEGSQLPPFFLNLEVEDGAFQYPDLPAAVNNIQLTTQIKSPSTDLDQLTVQVDNFSFLLGENPLAFSLALSKPISDPAIDASMVGTLNLGTLNSAFPMEAVKQMAGVIDANARMKFSMSALEKAQYDQTEVKGNIILSNAAFAYDSYPPVKVEKATVSLSPDQIAFSTGKMQLGKSDLEVSGYLDNVVALLMPDKTMTGAFNFRSDRLDANEWLVETTATQDDTEFTPGSAVDSALAPPFDRFSFSVDGQIGKLLYDIYELDDMVIKGRFSPQKLEIRQFETILGKSDIKASGSLNQLYDYVFDDGTITGNIEVRSAFFDLNPFMTEEEAEPDANASVEYEPMVIPERLNIDIQAKMDRVRYTNLDLTNLKGGVEIKNQRAELRGVKANALGGEIGFEGSYDTGDPESPAFDMETNVRGMDVRQAFEAFNTFQAAAPIAGFITGTFSTDLSLSGLLGQDLSPVYESLNAKGFFETINSAIKNYKPLQELGKQFQIASFDNIRLENTRNWFEIKEGRVTVEPFDQYIKDIKLTVEGSHLLSGGMDYEIKVKVPASYAESAPGGSVLTSAIGALGAEAQKLGLPFKKPEFYNFLVSLNGNIDKPEIGIRFVGGEGEGGTLKKVEESIQEKIGELKDTVQERAKEEIDKVRLEMEQKAAEARKKAEEEAKKRAAEARKKLEAEKKKAEEEARKKAEELKKKLEEEARKKLEELNPLKKKGGGN